MSNFYKEIKIPLLLDQNSQDKIIEIKKEKKYRSYVFLTRNPREFLTRESFDFFSTIDLIPSTMIIFGHVNDPNYNVSFPVIHTDVVLDENIWKKVPFAINSELTDTVADLKWFDPGTAVEMYPPNVEIPNVNKDTFYFGNAIHYHERNNRNSDGMSCLETYTFTQGKSVLIKTDIPHAPYYGAGYENRSHVSLRFPVDKISSYDQALEFFKPFWW